MSDCVFCNMDSSRVIDSNERFYVIKDGYPVTDGHILVIPKRHVCSFFELDKHEQSLCLDLLKTHQRLMKEEDDSIMGFNIGVNVGEEAGQTVMHCHVHLIPRRKGDMDDPRGGVRGVIPDKQKY